jgi:hypothetical protein
VIATASGELVIARERLVEVIEAFEREGTATTLGDYLTIPRPQTLAQYSFVAQHSVCWTRQRNYACAVCVRLVKAGTTLPVVIPCLFAR